MTQPVPDPAALNDIYEALKALRLQALQSDVNDDSNEWGKEALEMARAALDKAEQANEWDEVFK